MLPVALVELLTESYLLFRRLLAAYGTYGEIKDFVELADVSLNKDLRNHKTVIGEEVFLFILGKSTLDSLNPMHLWTNDEVNALALTAMYQSVENRSSPDVQTCVLDYATFLGKAAQTFDSSFADRCDAYINQGDGEYVLADPFFEFVKKQTDAVDEDMAQIFTKLGVTPEEWATIMQAIRIEDLSYLWENPMNEILETRPHKTQTFVALVGRGAETVRYTPPTRIPILGGTDSFDMNMSFLSRPKPYIPTRDRIPDDRGVTNEMVADMSRNIMQRKNYVKTDRNEWVHIADAKWSAEANKGEGAYVRKTITINQESENAKRQQELIESVGKSALRSIFNAIKSIKLSKSVAKRMPQLPQSTGKMKNN